MKVVVYDPRAADAASAVRGIGRYLQLLHESLPQSTRFVNDIQDALDADIFINPFFNVIQYPLFTKRIAKKQIAIIHDLIPLKYPRDFPLGMRGRFAVFRNKQSLGMYDLIVTDSDASKNDIIKILGVPENVIHVIYPCLSKRLTTTAHFTPGVLKKVAKPYVVYVGDATANKNLLVTAAAIKHAAVTAVFVGKTFGQPVVDHPWTAHLKKFKQITENDDRFIFPGFVTDEELTYIYKNAAANILLSTDEGFGFSYLEAAACKTPSLLSDRPIFHETAADTALFTKPTDPEEAAGLIKLLVTEKKMRDELGEKAYERSKIYSEDQFTKDWKNVLKAE